MITTLSARAILRQIPVSYLLICLDREITFRMINDLYLFQEHPITVTNIFFYVELMNYAF